MLKKIEALRKKPKNIRNRYAFWIATIATLVVVVVWGTTLPTRFAQTAENTSTSAGLDEFGNALGEISSNLSDTLNSVRSQAELYEAEYREAPEEEMGTTTDEMGLEPTIILLGTTTATTTPNDE